MRDEKARIIKYINKKLSDLQLIQEELPEDLRIMLHLMTVEDDSNENYPEKKFEVNVVLPTNEKSSEETIETVEQPFVKVKMSYFLFKINRRCRN